MPGDWGHFTLCLLFEGDSLHWLQNTRVRGKTGSQVRELHTSRYKMALLFTFLMLLIETWKACDVGEIPGPHFGCFKNKAGSLHDLSSSSRNWGPRSVQDPSCKMISRALPLWNSPVIPSEVWRQTHHSCYQLFCEAAPGAPKSVNTNVCIS